MTSENNNLKPCVNCGKLIPKNNKMCYSCETDQTSGKTYVSYKKKAYITEKGLKCVRCGSSRDLEYYFFTKSVNRRMSPTPRTTVLSAHPSFKFPTCSKCAKGFRKWNQIKWLLIFLVILWAILIVINLIFNLLNLTSIVIISLAILGAVIPISFILQRAESNPQKWMDIKGHFSLNDKVYRYKGYVKNFNTDNWIPYEEWKEQIKSIE